MKERPTTDRAKEGLFNILQNRLNIEEVSVLDLFAGSGSISLEFVSRGAKKVTAVEKNRQLSLFLTNTADSLGMEELEVKNDDALRFLKRTRERYDLLFADPPYGAFKLYHQLLDLFEEQAGLEEEGLLILEHDNRVHFEERKGYKETRSFGKTHFSFFVH